MKKFITAILFMSAATCAMAQDAWTASDIADSLKREAYSVIRDFQVSVTATSDKAKVSHYHLVVTILNKKGDGHASWGVTTSNFEQLSSFSGKIYDGQGKVKTKLKRGDVHSSQYSQHLATDNVRNYYEPPVMDYPYTVEYDWEVKSTDGYMDYEFFSPVNGDRMALEKASMKLTIPAGTKIRYMGLPNKWEPQKQTAGKNDVYSWDMPARRCFIDEEYDDLSMFIVPSVIVMPYEFRFGETTGVLDTWENKGKWYAELAEGRGTLLPADVQMVKELTAGCKDDKEKIAAIYKYLGEKTRYVSIQLGIGGWQPMPAQEVGKTGFGDCKALTNYMQAMLKEVGIESCQTIISTRYPELLKDFPNMFQTNHVILTIPQSDGSNMVVECTNPQLPLGFVPGSYAGHQALQVANGTGKLIRIADYTPENNYENLSADVKLQADGKATVGFSVDHYGSRYGSVRSIVNQDDKERKERVTRWVYLQDAVMESVKVNETKTGTPHLDVQGNFKVTYGKVNGNKLFITCDPFHDFHVPRFRKDRTRPVIVDDTYTLSDEIRIELPEGYAYSAGQSNETSTTDFGSYNLDIRQDGSKLIVKSKVVINKGRFDLSKKDEFASFREKLSKLMKKQIILSKD